MKNCIPARCIEKRQSKMFSKPATSPSLHASCQRRSKKQELITGNICSSKSFRKQRPTCGGQCRHLYIRKLSYWSKGGGTLRDALKGLIPSTSCRLSWTVLAQLHMSGMTSFKFPIFLPRQHHLTKLVIHSTIADIFARKTLITPWCTANSSKISQLQSANHGTASSESIPDFLSWSLV